MVTSQSLSFYRLIGEVQRWPCYERGLPEIVSSLVESGEECGRVRMVTNLPVRGTAVIQMRDGGGVE